MTRLVSLYPRAWRDRYEPEFLALLAERPPERRDRIDIVRGAIDARLHPELRGAVKGRRRSRAAVLTGVAVAAAGLGWLAWIGLILRDFRGWGAGQPATADVMTLLAALGFLAMTIALVAIAVTFGDAIRPAGLPGATLAGVGFAFTAFGGGLTLLLGFIGVILLAWSMSDRVVPRWLAVVWIGSVALACSGFVAFIAGQGREVGLISLGVPFGIAWVTVGAWIAVATSCRVGDTPARVHGA